MNEETLLKIKRFLVERLDPDFIVLFGSYATGQEHSKSDVDLAFYNESHEKSSYDVFFLAQELADLIGTDVDLVDLSKASTVFKMQIFAKGWPLYVTDSGQFDRYEMLVYRMYADLNEQRKEVLKEIHESGSVYGNRLRCSEE